MRLHTQNVGNVHEAIKYITRAGAEKYFHSLVSFGATSILIWKFDSYEDYVEWSKKYGRKEIVLQDDFENGGYL